MGRSLLKTTIETRIFRTFASVNRREPVRILYGANMRIRVGYVRYAKVILPQMRFRLANMVRMCENLGEPVRSGPKYAKNPALDSRDTYHNGTMVLQ